MNLRTLSHDEFLKYADSQVASELEREMLRRLEAPGFDQDMLDAMWEGKLDAQKVRDFMSSLSDYDIETPDDLHATLDEGCAYKAAANAHGFETPEDLDADLGQWFAYAAVLDGYGVETVNDLIDILERNTEQNPRQKEA